MKINLLEFEKKPIYLQLQLEEALLRTSDQNFCIINSGSPTAIVLGISSNVEEHLNLDEIKKDKIPVYQRFSGGGVVVVDENTIFVTFIFQTSAHKFEPFPKEILEWGEGFYLKALKLPDFSLQENDYALGNKKISGNAQYLRKNNWLLHTTHLYDYSQENMNYLKQPKLQPDYRNNRDHLDFLTPLKNHITKEEFIERIKQELIKRYTILTPATHTTFPDHRKSTKRLF